MLATDIPKFFIELGKVISEKKLSYERWYENNQDALKEIAATYLQ